MENDKNPFPELNLSSLTVAVRKLGQVLVSHLTGADDAPNRGGGPQLDKELYD